MTSFSVPAPAIPEGGTPIIGNACALHGESQADADLSTVRANGAPFESAFRLRNHKRPRKPWDIQLCFPTNGPVRRGDSLLGIVYLRALKTSNEDGAGVVGLVFEAATEPFVQSYARDVDFGKDWEALSFAFVALEDYEPGQARFNVRFGFYPQTIELGGAAILNYGTKRGVRELPRTSKLHLYKGAEPSAAWRELAQYSIDKHRKGQLEVLVRLHGDVVPGARVRLRMTRHAYKFGSACSAAMLGAPADSAYFARRSYTEEDVARYRDVVARYYNEVVFENDLKHEPWLAGQSRTGDTYSRDFVDQSIRFLKKHEIGIRGHHLSWGPLEEDNERLLGTDSPHKARSCLLEHAQEKLLALREHVTEWDALNHPVADFGRDGKRIHDITDAHIYRDILKLAHAVHPEARLYANEGSIMSSGNKEEDYAHAIAGLLSQGAPLRGLGFMCHFSRSTLTGMDLLRQRLNRFAGFGLPLKATEFDVNVDDEGVQAAYLRDFMTLWFSHPATVGIVMWGFWEAHHWRPKAALYRRNWQLKPNGEAWLDLVRNQWWTSAQGETDRQGAFGARGFLGRYEVTAEANGRSVSVPAEIQGPGTSRVVIDLG
jgi:GH35 family endo-1,4-beta-xylanase